MLKLKLQYFGHLMQRADSLEKTLMLGKTAGRRRRQERMRWLDGITNDGHEFEQALGVGNGQGSLACCNAWGHKVSDTTEQLNSSMLLLGLPRWLSGKEPAASAGDTRDAGSIPGSGRSSGEVNDNPLQ